MPLGFERLNERTQRPNALINFIKPLETPDRALAQDFLERIAAICYPIMKANHIAVMALEEYPPNPEFVGRNFNAGEVVQLVLKSPGSGAWLPFRHVQMVMMHELAHCKQMNHSGAFWKVRDQYAGELRGLWDKSYTGEGLWGRGKTLLSGRYTNESMPEAMSGVEHLCGGTFRSSGGRKRKRGKLDKPKVTYAERQQRRIAKKFGTNGVALGNDEDRRVKLEHGKKPKGKPRVAGSARGRDLRAAAALARFEPVEKENVVEGEDSGSETESDNDGVEIKQEALDLDGTKLVDAKGHGMVKVCEDEDEGDGNARRERNELWEIDELPKPPRPSKERPQRAAPPPATKNVNKEDISTASEGEDHAVPVPLKTPTEALKPARKANAKADLGAAKIGQPTNSKSTPHPQTIDCPMCSMSNEADATTCIACANVLDLKKIPKHWRCQSLVCRGGNYANAADCGICGVCGASKAVSKG
ncbi:WLM domain-containing protein [Cryomyces antarcticus]